MRAYVSTWTDTAVDGLKTKANATLTEYSTYVVQRERPKILEEVLKDRSFTRDFLVAFCGAFVYSLALLLAAAILKHFGVDIIHALS
jgi:hypothetical protein